MPTQGEDAAARQQGEIRERIAQRYQRLTETKRMRAITAVIARFQEIDGSTQGTLVSIQLFTTVIPLVILGFGYFSGFADNVSPGSLFIREAGLHHPLSDRVREAFGDSAGLRSSWTVIGIAGFLVWGIPMSITIAGIFAKAWRREQYGLVQRLVRGAVWFALYLVMLALRERITFAGDWTGAMRVLLSLAGLLPVWVFWSLTPAVLVRDGGRGPKYLLLAGLVGMAIDGALLPGLARLAFPALLSGWDGFGPIGVAMTLILWCGVIGTGWVLTACAGAVLWERMTPPATVIQAQSADGSL